MRRLSEESMANLVRKFDGKTNAQIYNSYIVLTELMVKKGLLQEAKEIVEEFGLGD